MLFTATLVTVSNLIHTRVLVNPATHMRINPDQNWMMMMMMYYKDS